MNKQEIINKLLEIQQLRENWNGYDAKPIPIEVITKALFLIEQLNPLPNFISPTGRESVQLEWEKDSCLYLEMEIFENKIEIFNMFSDDNEDICIGDK